MSVPHAVMIAALVLGVMAFAVAAGAAFGPFGIIGFVLVIVGVSAMVVGSGVVLVAALVSSPMVLTAVVIAGWVILR